MAAGRPHRQHGQSGHRDSAQQCGWFLGIVDYVALLVAIFAVPVSMGVAILKYRLYDIDRIISRTLGYAIITGLLVGIYAGLVLLATEVFRIHS